MYCAVVCVRAGDKQQYCAVAVPAPHQYCHGRDLTVKTLTSTGGTDYGSVEGATQQRISYRDIYGRGDQAGWRCLKTL